METQNYIRMISLTDIRYTRIDPMTYEKWSIELEVNEDYEIEQLARQYGENCLENNGYVLKKQELEEKYKTLRIELTKASLKYNDEFYSGKCDDDDE